MVILLNSTALFFLTGCSSGSSNYSGTSVQPQEYRVRDEGNTLIDESGTVWHSVGGEEWPDEVPVPDVMHEDPVTGNLY